MHRSRSGGRVVLLGACARDGCGAAPLNQSNCLGHAASDEIGEAIDRWREGAPLVATEARIDNECLGRLFDALNAEDEGSLTAPLVADRRPSFPGEANFERAVFTGHADFHGVTFRGPAYFDGALFEGKADFRRAEFREHADFDGATFNASASFRGAIFDDHVGFQRARVVSHGAGFAAAKFRSYVDFEGAVFGGYLDLTEATFQLARRLGPFCVG